MVHWLVMLSHNFKPQIGGGTIGHGVVCEVYMLSLCLHVIKKTLSLSQIYVSTSSCRFMTYATCSTL